MKPDIILHVNYVEQGQTIDEMCERAVRWGYDGIEFRRKRAGADESPEEYVDAIAAARDAHGLRHVLFGYPGPDLTLPDADARKREVDEVVAFFRLAAKRFDMTVNNTFAGDLHNPAADVPYGDYTCHGSYVATEEMYEWAADGFKTLGPLAEELGFVFAFETHPCYLHDTPASAMKLVEMIGHPAVGVNLDYVNVTVLPDQPDLSGVLDAIGGSLLYIHFKNTDTLASGEHLRVGLGEGQINNRQFLRMLVDRGYEGPICLEAPRPGDREWYARQDMTYMKSLLDDCGG